MSLRPSSSRSPSACSGLMYRGEPHDESGVRDAEHVLSVPLVSARGDAEVG